MIQVVINILKACLDILHFCFGYEVVLEDEMHLVGCHEAALSVKDSSGIVTEANVGETVGFKV